MEQINRLDKMRYSDLKNIEKKWGTPFYLCYSDRYLQNLHHFKNAFLHYYNKIIVGYSFKTNYIPQLCQVAKEAGCYAEVVSQMEYELAQKVGYSPSKIILNGPIKTKELIYNAIQKGVLINIDSLYELEYVFEYRKDYPHAEITIGLRINVGLYGESGESFLQSGLRVGRFGFSEELLATIIPRIREHNIIINSVHGHTSSSDRAVANYEIIARCLLNVCQKYTLNDVEYFNMGGGYFGAAAEGIDVSNKPSYGDYASLITTILLNNEWFVRRKPYLVLEPGVSVVANVLDFVSRIYQHKTIRDKHFMVVDGSVFNVKPTMHRNNLPFELIKQTEEETPLQYVDVVGATCMEKDLIMENISVPLFCEGDFLLIKGVGAYTVVMNPTFINYLPPIIECNKNEYSLIRKRQTIDDFMNLYNF